MLFQHSYVLPPCLSAELIWSCFVSVHCHPGNNIPVNFYTEQLNRLVKEAIKNLGANKTEKATSRIGRAIENIGPVLYQVHHENNVTTLLGAYHIQVAGSQRTETSLLVQKGCQKARRDQNI